MKIRSIILFALVLTSTLCNASTSHYIQEAGTFWVNIVQTGASTYSIKIEVSAGEAIEIGCVKIPEIMDASELPAKTEIRPLAKEVFEIPIRFTADGSGSLWIAVKNSDDETKVYYFVFDTFNSARGSKIKPVILKTASMLAESGGSTSVMQFGNKTVKCDESLISGINESGLFIGTNAVSGVVLKGSAHELGGTVSSFDFTDWGLKIVKNRVGRIGSFFVTGTLAELPENDDEEAEAATLETRNIGTVEPEKKEDATQQRSNIEEQQRKRASTESTTKKERPEETEKIEKNIPESGPYTGAGPKVTIENLPVNKNWTAEGGGSGHFGETSLILPEEMGQLKSIESIELVLSIDTRSTASGNGRIAISTRKTLASTTLERGTYWLAHEYSSLGTPVGEFDTSYENEFRYDVTAWIDSNPAEEYFVRFLNLSRVPLRIIDIRLEVSGVR